MNIKLIDHLQASWELLEKSSRYETGDPIGSTYLYFAPIQERFSINHAEGLLSHDCSNSFAISLTQKTQNDLLDFRIDFDEALEKKKIFSVTDYPLPHIENLSDSSKTHFIEKIQNIEKLRGVLNALLTLRNWAYFPNDLAGSKNLKRIAASYLKIVLSKLDFFLKPIQK